MNMTGNTTTQKMTNYRWTICIMMFLALTGAPDKPCGGLCRC